MAILTGGRGGSNEAVGIRIGGNIREEVSIGSSFWPSWRLVRPPRLFLRFLFDCEGERENCSTILSSLPPLQELSRSLEEDSMSNLEVLREVEWSNCVREGERLSFRPTK